MVPLHAALLVLLALCASARPTAAQQLWRIDDDGPADFSSVQAAVDAASPGDTLLVRAGTYAAPQLGSKPLWIAREGSGSALLLGTTRVGPLEPQANLSLRGLEFAGASPALDASLGSGGLLLEECSVRGATTAASFAALRLQGGRASLVRCAVEGGAGAFPSQAGGPALVATNCELAVLDCSLTGGRGAHGLSPSLGGGLGASGARLEGGSLWLSGSALRGGRGGSGALYDSTWGGSVCGSGGSGGAGLEWIGAGATGLVRASSWSGGAGGASPAPCPDGLPGPDLDAPFAHLELLGGEALGASNSGPASSGEVLELRFEGPPGALLLGWHGPFDAHSGASLPLAEFGGALLPGLAGGNLMVFGPLGLDGARQVEFTVGALPQSVAQVLLQPLACTTSGCLLGAPTAIVLTQ